MWQLYVYSFIAGVLGANGLPHFIKGITGQKHQTPFGKPSSATENVVWGWLNLVVAGAFLYRANIHSHVVIALALLAIAVLVTAILNSNNWAKHPEYNK